MESSLVVKLFGLLEAAAGHPDGRPLADLASDVGLTKPTAHRILKTLVSLGYIERCGAGVYRQSARLRQLVTLGDDDRRLIEIADPFLRRLHKLTEETVNLGVLRQAKIVYLTVLESPQPLRRTVNPSMADPFASTALGRALVAHLPPERQAFLLKHTVIEKRTPHTVIDRAVLAKLLAQARDRGYATEENETDLGVMCVGAPVFDRHGAAAAVSVSVPTARANPERIDRIVNALKEAAGRISDKLKRGD